MTDLEFGCILEETEDCRDYKLEDLFGTQDVNDLPKTHLIKLIDAKNQGALQVTKYACTCFSSYHSIETMLETLTNQLITTNPVKGWECQQKYGTYIEGVGDYLKTAFKSLQENGCIADENTYQVHGYASLGWGHMPDIIPKIKRNLANNLALVTSYTVYSDSKTQHTKGYLTKSQTLKKVGGHAVCIIGYDEEGVIILNSYGSKWGIFKNGTFKVKWEDISLLKGIYVLFPNSPVNMIFNDVSENSPHAEAIKFVKEKELMKGTDSGRFEPDRPMTRREMAIVLERFYNVIK